MSAEKKEAKEEKPKKEVKAEKPKEAEKPKKEEKVEKPKETEKPKKEPEKPKKEPEKPKEKKGEKKKPVKESIHTVPLRKAFDKPQKKMSRAAIVEIKAYVIKHTRKPPKISENLNKAIWEKSKPPRKIKIKLIEEEEFATADLP